eukprot:7384053-Prymnesium_polylepis.3
MVIAGDARPGRAHAPGTRARPAPGRTAPGCSPRAARGGARVGVECPDGVQPSGRDCVAPGPRFVVCVTLRTHKSPFRQLCVTSPPDPSPSKIEIRPASRASQSRRSSSQQR